MASERIDITGHRLPSISARLGCTFNPSTARRIASIVACRMLSESISASEHSAIDHANAFVLIWIASASRRASVSFLESRRPSIGLAGSNITAAAKTGPAKGPRPASSTPQMRSSSEPKRDKFKLIAFTIPYPSTSQSGAVPLARSHERYCATMHDACR